MTNKEAIDILKNTAVVPDIHPDNVGLWDNAIKIALEALEQQKVGRWERYGKRLDGIYVLWKCSVCRNTLFSEDEQDRTTFHKYCGMCGAKMEAEYESGD